MLKKIKIGEKVLNVNYIDYIGDKSKWLKIRMSPFLRVLAISKYRVWNEEKEIFSVESSDISMLKNTPAHSNKIFNTETGFDMDRQLNRFLGVFKHKDEIKKLVEAKVSDNISKGNAYKLKRIEDAKNEIIMLEKEIEEHIEFCNSCGEYILKECGIK